MHHERSVSSAPQSRRILRRSPHTATEARFGRFPATIRSMRRLMGIPCRVAWPSPPRRCSKAVEATTAGAAMLPIVRTWRRPGAMDSAQRNHAERCMSSGRADMLPHWAVDSVPVATSGGCCNVDGCDRYAAGWHGQARRVSRAETVEIATAGAAMSSRGHMAAPGMVPDGSSQGKHAGLGHATQGQPLWVRKRGFSFRVIRNEGLRRSRE